MPKENQQGQEKTEKPTSRRIKQARDEGSVSKSVEVNSAAVLLAGITALVVFGGWMMGRLESFTSGTLVHLGEIGLDASNFQEYIKSVSIWLIKTLLPLFSIIAIVGIVINVLQSGFLYSTKAIKPKLSKLNPIKGLTKVFNQQGAVRLIFNVIKVMIVGYIGYTVVRDAWPQFIPLMDSSVEAIFAFLVKTILKAAYYIIGVMAIIAIIDYSYQKYKYLEGMKMSKEEIKEEHKMLEGDPKVKQQIRQTQFQLAFNTMIKELPQADVVVTNPVHVAIAMKYDPIEGKAPLVVGKGLRKLAEKIKGIAREHDIPIVENPPLARALYKACDIGEEIPGQFYQDVAEILAQIYQLNGDPTKK